MNFNVIYSNNHLKLESTWLKKHFWFCIILYNSITFLITNLDQILIIIITIKNNNY